MKQLAKWIKGFEEFTWLAAVIVAVILWVLTSISVSAEKVESRVRTYVDERHYEVEKRLDSMEDVLIRIDERVYQIHKHTNK